MEITNTSSSSAPSTSVGGSLSSFITARQLSPSISNANEYIRPYQSASNFQPSIQANQLPAFRSSTPILSTILNTTEYMRQHQSTSNSSMLLSNPYPAIRLNQLPRLGPIDSTMTPEEAQYIVGRENLLNSLKKSSMSSPNSQRNISHPSTSNMKARIHNRVPYKRVVYKPGRCPYTEENRPIATPYAINNPPTLAISVPPNWDEHISNTNKIMKSYQLFPIDASTQEYAVLYNILKPLNVQEINQIVNPLLWSRFITQRKEMLMAKSHDTKLLHELGTSNTEIERKQAFMRHPTVSNSCYNENFSMLFYCTKNTDNINDLYEQGLDERLGKCGSFGSGINFVDDPLKAIRNNQSGGILLIFGVLLGDCLSIDNCLREMKFNREPKKFFVEKRDTYDNFFDSMFINSKPHEYVIFNKYQCCPLYAVKYANTDSNSQIKQLRAPFGWELYLTQAHYSYLNLDWPLFAKTVFEKMKVNESESLSLKKMHEVIEVIDLDHSMESIDEKDEKCPICDITYIKSTDWCKLQCSHTLCIYCYHQIKVTRTTMSEETFECIKCPFCLKHGGTPIGISPNGTMHVTIIPSHCESYEVYNTIQIDYNILYKTYNIKKTAYLPNNDEGKEILRLLKIAWDRRHTFTLGTSHAADTENTLVWNIQHKIRQSGGAIAYGYPDSHYFNRVLSELKALGIE